MKAIIPWPEGVQVAHGVKLLSRSKTYHDCFQKLCSEGRSILRDSCTLCTVPLAYTQVSLLRTSSPLRLCACAASGEIWHSCLIGLVSTFDIWRCQATAAASLQTSWSDQGVRSSSSGSSEGEGLVQICLCSHHFAISSIT